MAGLYSISSHLAMIADRERTDAFIRAMQRHVEPGSTVIDLGAGTAIFAVVACKLGAKRVYAIEPDPVLALGREIARANGVEERIEFIPELSTRVSLREPADVVVADLGGTLPIFRAAAPSLADARDRLLRPGGVLLPECDSLLAALADSAGTIPIDRRLLSDRPFGVDLSPAFRKASSESFTTRLRPPARLLTTPDEWVRISYATNEASNFRGVASVVAQADGSADSVCVWFDRIVTGGCSYSNAPGREKTVYGQLLLSLQEPLELQRGDKVTIDIAADLVDGAYIWRWTTSLESDDGTPGSSPEQSTLEAVPSPLQALRRRAVDFVPQPSERSRVDSFILGRFDGEKELGEIAADLMSEFPEGFADEASALRRVADVVATHAA